MRWWNQQHTRSDDLQIDMNVEDDIDFSSTPAPKKKNNLSKEGSGGKTKRPYYPLNQGLLMTIQIWIKQSYKDQNVPNVLPHFAHLPDLDAPLLRGKYVPPIEFFQLYFTDDMINDLSLHTNAYAWANITQKQYYADQQGACQTISSVSSVLFRNVFHPLSRTFAFHSFECWKNTFENFDRMFIFSYFNATTFMSIKSLISNVYARKEISAFGRLRKWSV